MDQQRTASLSLRQGFGLGCIILGFGQLLICAVSGVIMFFLVSQGSIKYYGIPSAIGMILGLLICSSPGLILLIVGIRLMRDKNGLRFRFLRN